MIIQKFRFVEKCFTGFNHSPCNALLFARGFERQLIVQRQKNISGFRRDLNFAVIMSDSSQANRFKPLWLTSKPDPSEHIFSIEAPRALMWKWSSWAFLSMLLKKNLRNRWRERLVTLTESKSSGYIIGR